MKKFMQKILVFLCAAFCLFGCVACGTTGGGLGGKTAEERGRERFNQLPAAVYTIGETNENGWIVTSNRDIEKGNEIEIKANGEIIYGEYVHTLGRVLEETEDYYFFILDTSSYRYYERAYVWKKTKHLTVVDI